MTKLSYIKKYTKQVKQAKTVYFDTVKAIAETVFNEIVKPYCINHRLDFSSGMGSYAFFKNGDLYDCPVWLSNILDINMLNDYGIGCIMPNFEYSKYKG